MYKCCCRGTKNKKKTNSSENFAVPVVVSISFRGPFPSFARNIPPLSFRYSARDTSLFPGGRRGGDGGGTLAPTLWFFWNYFNSAVHSRFSYRTAASYDRPRRIGIKSSLSPDGISTKFVFLFFFAPTTRRSSWTRSIRRRTVVPDRTGFVRPPDGPSKTSPPPPEEPIFLCGRTNARPSPPQRVHNPLNTPRSWDI